MAGEPTAGGSDDQRLLQAMVRHMVEYPKRFRGIEDDSDDSVYAAFGQDAAIFVRDVALEARAFALVGASEVAIRAAEEILDEDARREEKRKREDEEEARQGVEARAAALWADRAWLSTDVIADCLYPYASISQVFRILKDLGYVEWVDGRYVATRKALDERLGEPDPAHPRQYLRWSKPMFELLRAEFARRSETGMPLEDEDGWR